MAFVPDVVVGEYVIVHVGFAIQKLDAEEAAQAISRDSGAELHALEVFLSQPHGKRPSREQVKRLADLIALPPRSWTPDALWSAYAHLKEGRVKGSSAERTWADLVSLVRFALGADAELKPFRDQVLARFENWMASQENRGRTFDAEQRRWLQRIAEQISVDTEVRVMDLEDVKFRRDGGLGRADALFGEELVSILDDLNRELVA